ncbi:TPA: hypothetical protein ACYUR3_002099 [Legionella pneumophila]
MTYYEIISLIIAGFTAIGTCGATILALYFWYRDKTLKLRFNAMHGDGYGFIPKIEGGYLVVRFTNIGYRPISLELAGFKFSIGLCFWKKLSIINLGMQNNNVVEDNLPKILQHGEEYTYASSWNDFIDECKKTKPRKITVYAYISSLNKEVRFNFNKELLKEISKDVKQ